MSDPTHDTITIAEELQVTRGESGDIHIVGTSEGVTVPANAIDALTTALEAFAETPTDAMPSGLAEAMGESGEDECPECGAAVRHVLGSEGKQCVNCGWAGK